MIGTCRVRIRELNQSYHYLFNNISLQKLFGFRSSKEARFNVYKLKTSNIHTTCVMPTSQKGSGSLGHFYVFFLAWKCNEMT